MKLEYIRSLMYAEDTVLVADASEKMQKLIDTWTIKVEKKRRKNEPKY